MIRKSMKFLRFLFSILVIVAGPYIFLYFFINERGKGIFLNILKSKCNINASLQDMAFSFPCRIALFGFRLKNVKLSSLTADVSGLNPFTKEIVISRLYIKGLNVRVDKDIIQSIIKRKLPAGSNEKLTEAIEGLTKPYSLKINSIIFNSASFTFSYSALKHPLNLSVNNLSGTIKKFKYPSLGKMEVNLNASLEVNGRRADNALSASGWVDWMKKNMDLLLRAKNIDYFMFKDYYPPFWKPDNLSIKEARLSLNSRFLSKNDNLLIDYYIVLNKIVFDNSPTDMSKIKSLKTVIALFTQDGRTAAHFSYHTKMSKPQFNINSIGESLLTQLKDMSTSNIIDSMNRIFGKAHDAAASGVESIKGITVDPMIKGLQQAGEEFLKNMKGILGVGGNKGGRDGK